MLNKADLNFIQNSRKEIRTLREESVTLSIRTITGSHPVTDELIYDVTEVIKPAVVTKVTSVGGSSLSNDNEMTDSIKIVTGDISVDINLEDFPKGTNPEDVNLMMYNDVTYKVVSFGTLGLGGNNRVELLGRRTY